jgi:UDP-N-acetylmuramoylalanine--D-glutamate ligase
LIAEAIRLGIPLSNDSQIFLEVVPCPVIGITGSAGKTTTTTLVGRIAEAGGRYRKVWVGGNIGLPLIDLVDQMTADDLVVMELSSFQLEIMTCSPQVAAVLNITPNHLDRHATMENYTAAKAHILEYQSDHDLAILGRDDPGSISLAHRAKGRLLTFGISPQAPGAEGVELSGNTIVLRQSGDSCRPIMERGKIQLRGEHNLLNVMAACAIAAGLQLPVEAMQAGVEGFGGVAHRLELVRQWRGAAWYNDSIATAPERAMAAIRAFSEPLILLAGGRDKKLPWEDFARLVYQRVDHLVIFGEAASLIEQACRRVGSEFQNQPGLRSQAEPLTITCCPSLAQAVRTAADLVNPGDVVILSPGGTSFDEFCDFEERGKCFAQWVKELD